MRLLEKKAEPNGQAQTSQPVGNDASPISPSPYPIPKAGGW